MEQDLESLPQQLGVGAQEGAQPAHTPDPSNDPSAPELVSNAAEGAVDQNSDAHAPGGRPHVQPDGRGAVGDAHTVGRHACEPTDRPLGGGGSARERKRRRCAFGARGGRAPVLEDTSDEESGGDSDSEVAEGDAGATAGAGLLSQHCWPPTLALGRSPGACIPHMVSRSRLGRFLQRWRHSTKPSSNGGGPHWSCGMEWCRNVVTGLATGRSRMVWAGWPD